MTTPDERPPRSAKVFLILLAVAVGILFMFVFGKFW